VSGYTVRPPEARLKPKVSAFINAKFDKILALEPDLVFAFSDLQAEIAAELIRRGVTVMTFNQRSIAEILEMILTVGRIVGGEEKLGRWCRCCRLRRMPYATRRSALLTVRESCLRNGTSRLSREFVGLRS
jgi:iron complex transport system substrate-binding protein